MAKLSDFHKDPHNLNKGTKRGSAQLEKSLRDFGFGRPILAASDGTIVAGNHTLEAAAQLGFSKVRVVETDGDEVIVHKRRDLDPNDPKTKLLGLADNRVGEINFNVDVSGLAELAALEPGVMDFYSGDELALLQDQLQGPSEGGPGPVNPQMAASPDSGQDDEDDDEEEGPDVLENEPDEDDDEDEEEDDEDEGSSPARVSTALAIVLTPQELRTWKQAKAEIGYSRDKAALLALAQRFLEEIRPASGEEIPDED